MINITYKLIFIRIFTLNILRNHGFKTYTKCE